MFLAIAVAHHSALGSWSRFCPCFFSPILLSRLCPVVEHVSHVATCDGFLSQGSFPLWSLNVNLPVTTLLCYLLSQFLLEGYPSVLHMTISLKLSGLLIRFYLLLFSNVRINFIIDIFLFFEGGGKEFLL